MIKENLGIKGKILSVLHKKEIGYKLVIIFVVFLMPIYPLFASFVHNNTEYDFYRGFIDENSIIGSYFSEVEDAEEGENLYEVKDSFFAVNTILDDNRDLSGTNEIIEYTIEYGDSISTIAHKFQVSRKSIYDSNDFSTNHIIHPGDVIKIPPVTGIIHVVAKGESLSSISKKYGIELEKIEKQNLLATGASVSVGDELVIPGGEKPKPVYVAPKKTYTATTSSNSSGGYSFATGGGSQYVNAQGSYKLTAKPKYHTFYWGNCTWYVAKYKTVNWGGNANQWLANARAKGRSTGTTPQLGAIIAFEGRGYNPRYGHVGIVMDIKGDHLIVSDMNYRRLGEITYRKVPINDRSITGYIYGE